MTDYKTAFQHLGLGSKELMECGAETVVTHKMLIALLISMMTNVMLLVSFVDSRYKSETLAFENYQLETKLNQLTIGE